MSLPARIAAAALAAVLLSAAPAAADDYCVGDGAGCFKTLAEALDAARAHTGPDRVLLPAGDLDVPAGPADGPGEPVELIGKGPTTHLTAAAGATATLRLEEPASRATSLVVAAPGPGASESLVLAGAGGHLVVSSSDLPGTSAVRLLAGARLSDSLVGGPVAVVAPARIERSVLMTGRDAAISVEAGADKLVAEDLEIKLDDGAAAAFVANCATVAARHLTITGAADRVADLACAVAGETAALDLRDAIVKGAFPDVVRVAGTATATSDHSMHADDTEVTATARLTGSDPGFVSATDLRLRSDSPLIDAGGAQPLQAGEGFWDLGSLVRVADGDGDGVVRRDVGAHERQGAPVAPPDGNVLANPGAEAGDAIFGSGQGPEPPGWTRTGSFTAVGYGTESLPTRESGDALGGGRSFFSAGPGAGGTLVQRIDLTASAAEIDTGLGSAALSGLVGGYGADEDEVRVTASFRDPEGGVLGALALGPVPAAERGNATNLLARSAAGSIPARTRAIDVEVSGVRVTAPGVTEAYTDAYADNLALVLSVPGISVPGPVDPGAPPVKNLKPFSGVTVLTGRPSLSKKGRAKVKLACASATVGACAGSLELRAQLRRGEAFSRIAQFARFRLGPGRSTSVTIKLTLAAQRALRRTKSFRATLRAVVQDGQGLERKTTIPIRVRKS
jgi:hypothetical protein